MAGDTQGVGRMNFQVPEEMRNMAERSVTQARQALESFMQAARRTTETMEQTTDKVQAGAKDMAQRTFSSAEQNIRTSLGAVAKFWRLPRVEHAGRMGASEPEVAHDPERPGREAEAPVEGRFQGPALRSDADPAGGLLVPPLPAQLSRHRRAVSGARLRGGPLHPEPLGAGLRAPDRAPAAALPQTPLWLDPGR